jgi:hypothetical protein
MENATIIKRYESNKSERSNVESVWTTISDYVVPFRGEFYRDLKSENEIDWRSLKKFDDTAVEACNTLAASIQGALTSPVVRWHSVQFKNQELMDNKSARDWLNTCSEIIYTELQKSNFNLQMAEGYLDLCSFGTVCMTEEEETAKNGDFSQLLFNTVFVRDVFFDEDYNGKVVNFYRCFQWTALQIREKFGSDKIPDDLLKQIEAGTDINTKHSVIFCIYKRDIDVDTTKLLEPAKRPYGYKYILQASAETLGEEGGYYEMPVFITQWGRASGSKWGFSPAHQCLGDITTLNVLKKSVLIATDKVIDPPVLARNRGVLGDLDLSSGGVTIVREGDAVAPFESKARFDVSALQVNDLRASIRRAFKVDQLELKESPAMTATEVQVRYELMQRLLGPTLGRLQNNLLDPLIHRTFFILYRAGQFPEPPDIIFQGHDNEIEIEYLGPMAKAHKMDKLVAVSRWFQVIGPLSEVKPEVLDIPDTDEIATETAILLDIPVHSKEDIKRVRDARMQQQQELQQAQLMKAKGEAVEQAQNAIRGEENAGEAVGTA